MSPASNYKSGGGVSVIDQLGVGAIAANFFPVNVGGGFVSSASQTAKAGILQGTTYVMGGANSYLYGSIAYAGLGAGGLLLNNVDGPLKFMASGRANSAGNRAVAIGAGVSGTSPVLDVLDVGFWDTTGPTWYSLYKTKGDGLVQVDNVTSEYMCNGGRLSYDADNGRLETGWSDTDNQSRSGAELAADGYTLDLEGGAGSIAEGASNLLVTIPATENADWWGGTYGAYHVDRALPPNWRRAWISYDRDNVDDTGVSLMLRMGSDADNFQVQSIQLATSPGVDKITAVQGPATSHYDAAVGADIGWLCFDRCGYWIRYGYSNNAWNNEPGWDDWTWVYTLDRGTDDPFDCTISAMALSVVSKPGCTQQFGHFRIAA